MNNLPPFVPSIIAMLIALSTLIASPARALEYQLQALQPLSLDDIFLAVGLNELGQVVGTSQRLILNPFQVLSIPTIWQPDGTPTDLTSTINLPNNLYPLSLLGITNSSLVLGSASSSPDFLDPEATTTDFIFNINTPATPATLLATPSGGTAPLASSINNTPHIVGYDTIADQITPVIWQADGQTIELVSPITLPPGLTHNGLVDINDLGEIIGLAQDTELINTPFRAKSSGATNLFTHYIDPALGINSALGINNTGHTIGYATNNATGIATPLLWSTVDGSPHPITASFNLPAGTTLAQTTDINDRGQIIGATTDGLTLTPFLATPNPETLTWNTPAVAAFSQFSPWTDATNFNRAPFIGDTIHFNANGASLAVFDRPITVAAAQFTSGQTTFRLSNHSLTVNNHIDIQNATLILDGGHTSATTLTLGNITASQATLQINPTASLTITSELIIDANAQLAFNLTDAANHHPITIAPGATLNINNNWLPNITPPNSPQSNTYTLIHYSGAILNLPTTPIPNLHFTPNALLYTPTHTPGDLNFDNILNPQDVDELSLAINLNFNSSLYDFNNSNTTTPDDGPAMLDQVFNTLPGDFNLDGQINIADLIIWAQGFGPDKTYSQGDANFNSQVNIADLIVWAQNFGNTSTPPLNNPLNATPAAIAIPEPSSSLYISTLAALTLLRPKRKN